MKKITWTLVSRKISELKPYEFNPRDITEKGLKDLKQSIDKFGLAEPIIINTDNIIIGGHARFFVLKEKGIFECDCYLPNRRLNKKEYEELNVRLNKNIAGTWDWDVLANNFEIEELKEWGFDEKIFDKNELKDLSDQLDSIYEIVIECNDENEQKKIYNNLKDIYKCRILIL